MPAGGDHFHCLVMKWSEQMLFPVELPSCVPVATCPFPTGTHIPSAHSQSPGLIDIMLWSDVMLQFPPAKWRQISQWVSSISWLYHCSDLLPIRLSPLQTVSDVCLPVLCLCYFCHRRQRRAAQGGQLMSQRPAACSTSTLTTSTTRGSSPWKLLWLRFKSNIL